MAQLIVDVMAVRRLVRLVTKDEITRPARERIGRADPRLAYLVGCEACVSLWAALAVATGVVPRRIRTALALSESAIWAGQAANWMEAQ